MLAQEIIDTKTFAKEPKKAIFCKCQRTSPFGGGSKDFWFFSDVVNAQLAVFWVICCGTTCWMGAFHSSHCHKHNRHVNACIVKTYGWIVMFRRLIYLMCRPVRRTTRVEDTYWTLTAISFKVRVNNSLKIFAIASVLEKLAVSFPI